MREVFPRDPRPGVVHLDERGVAVPAHRHAHLSSAVLQGVPHQVRNDPLEPATVGSEDQPVASDCDPSVPAAGSQDRPQQRQNLHRLFLHGLPPCVEPGDLHELVYEPAQTRHVLDQQLGGATRLRRHPVEMLPEDRRLADQGGERRTELVGHVGGEAAFSSLGVGQRGDLRLEGFRHLVERGGPHPELVLTLHRKARRQQPLGHRPSRQARTGYRVQGPLRERAPHDAGEKEHHDPPDQQHVA